MGKVISATIIRDNGTTTSYTTLEAVPEASEDALISYHYAYGPNLLPDPAVSRDGMWRYGKLLPIDGPPRHYPLAVGNTPLLAPANLRARIDCPHLWLKDETRTPSGSNKDRATALVLEQALRRNIPVVSCASTGNVAVSLALGAAASGLSAMIFVPDHVSDTKLKLMLFAGATVFKVAGGYEAAFALSRQAAHVFGWYDRNTGVNPLTLEAKKTAAFEIWEQLGRHMPDAVVVPLGDGLTLSALAKGFRELLLCGAAGCLPRLIGVQAEGCQPLKRAWEAGTNTTREDEVDSGTIADGIAVARPVGGALALQDIRASNGGIVSVSDDALLQAIQVLARTAGVLAEPAAAAALAGLTPAFQAGLLQPHETIVLHITGSGLKQAHYLSSPRTAWTIPADLKAVEEVVTVHHS